MHIANNQNNFSFEGITKIFALTDSHQESRKTAALFSEIMRRSKSDKNVLLLNGGDLFKGVYSKELERDIFLRTKKLNPNIEMVTTIGNNDFGFYAESLKFLADSMRKFIDNGIRVVCANIFDTNGQRPDWMLPYTVVERDGDRNLITGFCINNINVTKFGIIAKNQQDVIEKVIDAVKKERPDNFIIINHDHLPSTKFVYEEFKKRGLIPDLIIGGHEHDSIPAIPNKNIYYPEAFCKNMIEMKLENNGTQKVLKDIEIIQNDGIELITDFERDVSANEKKLGLMKIVAPRVLNLCKTYSDSCSLGTFLADGMKNVSGSDIAFFSTGFLMAPLEYKYGGNITNYDLAKTISADNTIQTLNLTADDLKKIFGLAFKVYKQVANTKFLQCSQNVTIQGKFNNKNEWEILDILIDNTPISSDKVYKCCTDSYLANGGQGYSILQNRNKELVLQDNQPLMIKEVLKKCLINAKDLYKAGADYPKFKIEEIT